MGNCYTLHPQDPHFQGGVNQTRKNLFRQSQDSNSWQNGQGDVRHEFIKDNKPLSGFYEPGYQDSAPDQKELRQPAQYNNYPRVSDWSARSGVKQDFREDSTDLHHQPRWGNHNMNNIQQEDRHARPQVDICAPDFYSNEIQSRDERIYSQQRFSQLTQQNFPQFKPLEEPSSANPGSQSQFVSLTPSGNTFSNEAVSPVGGASVFQIGGRSQVRNPQDTEIGIHFASKDRQDDLKKQNQKTISKVMISKLPEKAARVVSRCEKLNPESYAVQVTRAELPLQTYGDFGKRKDEGPYLLSDGGTYLGSLENQLPQGKGKWVGTEGQVYEGGWKQGFWHGEGRFISSTGDIFQGGWQTGQRSGKGLMQLLNGYLYRGQWQDDLPHGVGHQRESNGDQYDGPFVNGIKEGDRGELKIAATAESYVGKFQQGVMVFGKVVKSRDMEEYEGWLKFGLYDGVGELRNSEGLYNGEFLSGRRHGKGSMIYDGGSMEYQGSLKWGRQDGYGKTIHKPTGRVEQEGYWKSGKFVNAEIKFSKSGQPSLYSNLAHSSIRLFE